MALIEPVDGLQVPQKMLNESPLPSDSGMEADSSPSSRSGSPPPDEVFTTSASSDRKEDEAAPDAKIDGQAVQVCGQSSPELSGQMEISGDPEEPLPAPKKEDSLSSEAEPSIDTLTKKVQKTRVSSGDYDVSKDSDPILEEKPLRIFELKGEEPSPTPPAADSDAMAVDPTEDGGPPDPNVPEVPIKEEFPAIVTKKDVPENSFLKFATESKTSSTKSQIPPLDKESYKRAAIPYDDLEEPSFPANYFTNGAAALKYERAYKLYEERRKMMDRRVQAKLEREEKTRKLLLQQPDEEKRAAIQKKHEEAEARLTEYEDSVKAGRSINLANHLLGNRGLNVPQTSQRDRKARVMRPPTAGQAALERHGVQIDRSQSTSEEENESSSRVTP